jgi:hypothetical protein
MSNINDEIKATADYAIKSAKEKFGQELDYSDQSIEKLENLLEQAYRSFFNLPKDEKTSNAISRTANIWGNYLGEFMRLKWGGTWILKGSERFISINNIEFSPVGWVYQKITSHPEYSLENYLIDTKRIIYTSVINPQQSQYLSENIGQPKKHISIKRSVIPVTMDKHLLFTLAGIGGILLALVAFIIGFRMFKTGGISAFGLIASATSSNTNIPIENTLGAATSYSINTRHPTATPLPTYPTFPTFTPHPSYTPYLTYTQIATLTPTEMQMSFVPEPTLAPTMSPTSVPVNPTIEPIPPTKLPSPPATGPPVVIESCEIDPFRVVAGQNVTITFIVHFSSHTPGYGFEAKIDPIYPGQSVGCIGIDKDGDGIAYCNGSSGMLPGSTIVYVILRSSVGDCVATYSSTR